MGGSSVPLGQLAPRSIFVKRDPERVPIERQVIAVRVHQTEGLLRTGAPEGALARSLWYPESLEDLHGEFGLWLTRLSGDTEVYAIDRREVEAILSPEALAFVDDDREMGIVTES